MHEELLSEIGLTRSEISVYLALLDLGSSTTGPIIKKSGIASGKAYLILDKLIMKGLVTHITRSGVRYYQSKDPERLMDYMKEKENELKKKEESLRSLIPLLKQKYNQKKYENKSEIYEGVKGFKTFHEIALREMKENDFFLAMGVPRELLEKHDSYLINWNKRRVNLGIRMKILYNHDCRDFGKKRERMKLTEVRYMKPEMETPAWIDIFKDYVATVNVHGIPICFLIKNTETADSYRKYFDIIWKQTAKP